MKTLITLVTLSFALGLAAASSAAADNPGKSPEKAPDASGVWNVSVVFSGGGGNPVFTLKQDGEKLTGRYAGAFGEADVTGTIKGHDIKFGFTIEGQGGESYVGTVDGDTMKGKVTLGELGEGTFTAQRQPKK